MKDEQTMPLAETAAEVNEDSQVLETTEAKPTEADAQPEATETAQSAKFRLEYMGEEKEIDLEEARTLAQKGMNYDPIKEKWEASKSTISKFEEIARKAGFTNSDGHGDIDAYQTAANDQLKEMEIQKITQGTELPKELAEELYLARQERTERKTEKDKRNQELQKQEQYVELLDFYKEINGEDFDPAKTKLPSEVWKAVEKGTAPKLAYAEYMARDLVKQRAIEKQNIENSVSSPGSASKGSNTSKTSYTLDDLRTMSREDVLKNYNEVIKAKNRLLKE